MRNFDAVQRHTICRQTVGGCQATSLYQQRGNVQHQVATGSSQRNLDLNHFEPRQSSSVSFRRYFRLGVYPREAEDALDVTCPLRC